MLPLVVSLTLRGSKTLRLIWKCNSVAFLFLLYDCFSHRSCWISDMSLKNSIKASKPEIMNTNKFWYQDTKYTNDLLFLYPFIYQWWQYAWFIVILRAHTRTHTHTCTHTDSCTWALVIKGDTDLQIVYVLPDSGDCQTFFYIGHQISEIASSANSFKMLQKDERKYMTSKWTLAKSLVIAGIPSDHKACLGKQFSPVQVVHYLTLALQDKNMSALCPMILQGVFWNVSAKNMTTFYLAIVQPVFPCFLLFSFVFCLFYIVLTVQMWFLFLNV